MENGNYIDQKETNKLQCTYICSCIDKKGQSKENHTVSIEFYKRSNVIY